VVRDVGEHHVRPDRGDDVGVTPGRIGGVERDERHPAGQRAQGGRDLGTGLRGEQDRAVAGAEAIGDGAGAGRQLAVTERRLALDRCGVGTASGLRDEAGDDRRLGIVPACAHGESVPSRWQSHSPQSP
jgi:hypothetical protein